MFFDVKIGSLSNFRLSLSTKYNFKIIETCSVDCKNYFCNFHNKGTLFSKALWRSYAGLMLVLNGKFSFKDFQGKPQNPGKPKQGQGEHFQGRSKIKLRFGPSLRIQGIFKDDS